jgi:hypothetical protein
MLPAACGTICFPLGGTSKDSGGEALYVNCIAYGVYKHIVQVYRAVVVA